MGRPPRGSHARLRAALDATEIPTWSGPRRPAETANTIRFRKSPGWLPHDLRIYAVGDIHGCLGQLETLYGTIAADLAARPTRIALLLHLGDYIDQGPDSAGVLDRLLGPPPAPGLRLVNLLGDHERMLLEALGGDRAAATDWLHSGGKASLASWGLDPDLPREMWEAALPPAHLGFLRSLVLSRREGDYLFVHAGIRPGVSLLHQSPEDLVSIRQPFLWSEQDFGVVVVHGHSAGPEAVIGTNRIGLDTGAGMGGKLTCAVLEDDLVGLLAA